MRMTVLLELLREAHSCAKDTRLSRDDRAEAGYVEDCLEEERRLRALAVREQRHGQG